MSGYRAVFDPKGLLAEFENGECVYLRSDYDGPNRSETCSMPMVIRDIEPYKNMIDGRMITSRSEHRELLARHGGVEIGNDIDAHLKPKAPVTKDDGRKKLLHQMLADKSDRDVQKMVKQTLKGSL